MPYVAVKGGEAAIGAAHAWVAEARRGDPNLPALTLEQIANQLGRAVDRVMAEGALYDPALAALAIKQAQGDLIEAAFLLRAYRTTLPRLIDSEPVDTGTMQASRRISAIFKDLPGGQRLGPTTDYTHRLLDFALTDTPMPAPQAEPSGLAVPRVTDILGAEALLEPDGDAEVCEPDGDAEVCAPDGDAEVCVPDGDTEAASPPGDLTMEPLAYPAPRELRLQALARGDEGFLLALGYSTQRGYGNNHPFVGELRVGEVAVTIIPPELGFAIEIGDITLTECQMVNQFKGSKTAPPQFTRGYGLCFGHNDRKSIAMSLVDRAMRAQELGEEASAPAQDTEFVLSHCDNIEATGFVEHLKLPHHVDFQSELETIRAMRKEAANGGL